MKLTLLFLMVLFLNFSCTLLKSVTVTSIPKDRHEKVSSERYKFIFLMLNFNNDFVDKMEEDLAAKCSGKIQGIVTKTEEIVYFPILFHAYNVKSEGYCINKL